MTSATIPVPVRRRSPQDIASRAHQVLDAAPDLVNAADPQPEALERLAEEASVALMILLMAITEGQNGPQISPAGRAECTASADATPTNQGVHQ